ncbi:MAG: hypothetical protein KC731_30785 [Myxococcales bacterium]|nr:hypothetical protein [Myxococcales bacterium]
MAPAPPASVAIPAAGPPDLEAAYRSREPATRRAAFAQIAAARRASGATPSAGLALVGAVVVGDEQLVAVSDPASGLTYYFDRKTAEPLAMGRHLLRHDRPLRAGPFFMTLDGTLYDPQEDEQASLAGGHAFAVAPDGRHVFVLAKDCRIETWSAAPLSRERQLAPHPTTDDLNPPCDLGSFSDAVVADGGALLLTRLGSWTVRDGLWHPLPAGWGSRPPNVGIAIGPGGRYLARVRRDRPDAVRDRLSLLDRSTARTIDPPTLVGGIANTDALDFYDNPPRLCVVNYGAYAFSVPAMTPLAIPRDAAMDLTACATALSAAPSGDPELLAWLEQHLCTWGTDVLPREHCMAP